MNFQLNALKISEEKQKLVKLEQKYLHLTYKDKRGKYNSLVLKNVKYFTLPKKMLEIELNINTVVQIPFNLTFSNIIETKKIRLK